MGKEGARIRIEQWDVWAGEGGGVVEGDGDHVRKEKGSVKVLGALGLCPTSSFGFILYVSGHALK